MQYVLVALVSCVGVLLAVGIIRAYLSLMFWFGTRDMVYLYKRLGRRYTREMAKALAHERQGRLGIAQSYFASAFHAYQSMEIMYCRLAGRVGDRKARKLVANNFHLSLRDNTGLLKATAYNIPGGITAVKALY